MIDDLIGRKEALQVLEGVFSEYRMSWGERTRRVWSRRTGSYRRTSGSLRQGKCD